MISKALILISFIIIARLLGKEQFGKLGIIQITVMMFQIFAGFGLGLTATKYVSEFRKTDPSKAGRVIALSGVVALGTGASASASLIVFAHWLCAHTLHAPELTGVLRVSALLLFFSALNGSQTGTLSGLESFKAIAKVNFWSGLLSFVALIGSAYLGGLDGAVWGLAIGSAITWLITHIVLRRELRNAGVSLDFRNCKSERGVLLAFSLPAILAGIVVVPVNWACSAMLVRQPGGYAQMGIFNAVNQWFSALLFLPMVLEQVTLPMISERLGINDRFHSRKLLIISIKVNALIIVPLVLFGSMASPMIVRLYGKGFANAWGTLIIVLLTAGVFAIETPVGQLVTASRRMWTGFWMNLGWAVTMLISTKLLLSKGALGLASARLIAYCVHSLWTVAFAYRFIKEADAVANMVEARAVLPRAAGSL